jgi:hypothetical protein
MAVVDRYPSLSWLSTKRAQAYNFQQYTQKRNMYHIYANTLSRWTRYCPSLMSALTCIKRPSSPRQKGRRTKHLIDWMAHSHNLAKGSRSTLDMMALSAPFVDETQCHINTSCTHLPLVEVPKLIRRQVDDMSLRHQHLPQNQRWVLTLIDHMEEHIWTDSVTRGDLWNGRWTRDAIHALLPESFTAHVPHRDAIKALAWLQKLTGILQKKGPANIVWDTTRGAPL